jgi:hypothetical protein
MGTGGEREFDVGTVAVIRRDNADKIQRFLREHGSCRGVHARDSRFVRDLLRSTDVRIADGHETHPGCRLKSRYVRCTGPGASTDDTDT